MMRCLPSSVNVGCIAAGAGRVATKLVYCAQQQRLRCGLVSLVVALCYEPERAVRTNESHADVQKGEVCGTSL